MIDLSFSCLNTEHDSYSVFPLGVAYVAAYAKGSDLTVCKEIASSQEKHDWPKSFTGFAGKDQRERLLEGISMIRGAKLFSAAAQSTDRKVLENIKRQNISFKSMMKLSKQIEELGTSSFSEVILCLPGDS